MTMAREMNAEVTPAPAPAPEVKGFRIGRDDLVCVGPIMAHSMWLLFSIPIGPALLGTRPLLLSLLRGSVPAMITTGAFARQGSTSLLLALLAPVIITCFPDPFYYWAGMRYGRPIIEYMTGSSPRARRRMERAERLFQRYGALAIFAGYLMPFIPQSVLLLGAGEIRMRFITVAIADLGGMFVYISFYVLLGWFIGTPAKNIAEEISHYGLWLTIALVVVVFVVSFRRAMAAQAPPAE